jgi:hypothetical protein
MFNLFRKRRNFAILNFPTVELRNGIVRGVFLGGIVKAEILEETPKALRVRYLIMFVPKSICILPEPVEPEKWLLRSDNRIVEVCKS